VATQLLRLKQPKSLRTWRFKHTSSSSYWRARPRRQTW